MRPEDEDYEGWCEDNACTYCHGDGEYPDDYDRDMVMCRRCGGSGIDPDAELLPSDE